MAVEEIAIESIIPKSIELPVKRETGSKKSKKKVKTTMNFGSASNPMEGLVIHEARLTKFCIRQERKTLKINSTKYFVVNIAVTF